MARVRMDLATQGAAQGGFQVRGIFFAEADMYRLDFTVAIDDKRRRHARHVIAVRHRTLRVEGHGEFGRDLVQKLMRRVLDPCPN